RRGADPIQCVNCFSALPADKNGKKILLPLYTWPVLLILYSCVTISAFYDLPGGDFLCIWMVLAFLWKIWAEWFVSTATCLVSRSRRGKTQKTFISSKTERYLCCMGGKISRR